MASYLISSLADKGIDRTFASLTPLTLAELRSEWRRRWLSNAPKTKSAAMLRRIIAWRIQEEAFGGLSARARQQLRADPLGNDSATSPSDGNVRIESGTSLRAEWNGKQHCIEVLEIGFVWNGIRFATLADVAKAITGVSGVISDIFRRP